MGQYFGMRSWLLLLITAASIEAKKNSSIDIQTQCLGNLMRVNVGSLGGKRLEVAASIDNSTVTLTPSLASQCGFSLKMDPLGNAIILASIQNCFSQTVDDEEFTTVLNLRLKGKRVVDNELYQVTETCQYPAWASREIICDHNYMEVSVRRVIPEDNSLPEQPLSWTNALNNPRRAGNTKKWQSNLGFQITTIVFLTPEERAMTLAQAQGRGYGIANTPTRLVVRSSSNAPETYTQDVAGVPITVLKTSAIFEKKWLVTQIDAAAACPIPMGGVSFTSNTITWFLPRHLDPLVSSENFQILEVYMGIDGRRIDAAEMAARQYSLNVNDVYIITEIPVGAVGGHFKSILKDGQYLVLYSIMPMLELLWTEDGQHETRYKVIFPITTPLMSIPPRIQDNTVAEEGMFKLRLGPLGSDVALVEISFPTEILSVEEGNVRGFNILEHQSQNGSKAFTLEVPFTDRVITTLTETGKTVYSLHLTFGLLVLPESSKFAYTTYTEVTLVDKVPPSITGSCDYDNFYVTVSYGTHENFQTVIGKRMLTSTLAHQYGLIENGTHFSFAVPFSSPDAVYEAIESSSIKSRLDVSLKSPASNGHIKHFSVACSFFTKLIECFPNGTMTAVAVMLDSVPLLDLSQLTLKDTTCGPALTDDRFAYFVFSGSTCGTTRKFLSNSMIYENEITLPNHLGNTSMNEHPYHLKVSCYYYVNTTYAVTFSIGPQKNVPYAEAAKGELQVAMRLAVDQSYSLFYGDNEYPIPKYLREPLYFEVELMQSNNPKVSLELEHCWATHTNDRSSKPRWNLIINGCVNPVDPYQVVFHPVWPDSRVQFPSHLKRFEVQMFAFAVDQENLNGQLFVHCDVVICDSNNLGGVCSRQCSNEQNIKGNRRSVADVQGFKQVSSGPISYKINPYL